MNNVSRNESGIEYLTGQQFQLLRAGQFARQHQFPGPSSAMLAIAQDESTSGRGLVSILVALSRVV
jgi:hypothetical protein